MALPDANNNVSPDDANRDAGQQNIGDYKTCYYCGKRMPSTAPRCETCGNDRCFTWKNKRED